MLHDAEFWVLIAFVIFVGLVWKPIGRMIGVALDRRSELIKAEIEEAARLREEAQSLFASYQRRHKEAMQQAEDIVAHARAEADRVAKEAAAELEQSLKRREQLALQWIAQAEAEAVREVRLKAADLAAAAATRLMSDRLAGPEGDALVDQAIRELPNRLH